MAKKAPHRTAERILEVTLALFNRFETALNELLGAGEGVRDVEDAWFFMHSLFELIWQYRFLYRDLNDLLSKNRKLETHFQRVIEHKTCSVKALLNSMVRHRAMTMDTREAEPTATSMVVVLTYWLSFEYVRDPRHALEPEHAQRALLRGAHHVLNLLIPYLEPSQRLHLQALVTAYTNTAPAPMDAKPSKLIRQELLAK
jgi:hypothetical protein